MTIEIVYFPKKCPHCQTVLREVKKLSAQWLECVNPKCPAIVSDGWGFTCCVTRR